MRRIVRLFLVLVLPAASLLGQGTVYLVLGSDTAIWDGMDVSRYHCSYALSLYTDPSLNAARVMDPAFRSPLKDSFGTPVKLTWWMMAGNIFRHATNTNVPYPNTMTLHLMKQYQGAAIATWGDELTLHYHTFVWTDYNADGIFYWNQAHSFAESSDDFDVTLAEMLLEEDTFPVSFRSGWHAMDNGWQQRLDTLLPYSLHNDWPAKRNDMTEPLDNIYDWSRSPSSFIPFHPSPADYQVPGAGRGWNVRSVYMASADSAFMDGVFRAAATGTDQLACLWAHLPEADFLDNVRKVDASAHKVAPRFPGVTFRYCTAVEAMRLWCKISDTTRPGLTFGEIREGDLIRWSVTSTEPLFQPAPFIAVKDRYGDYRVLPCRQSGERSWQTSTPVLFNDLAKVGIAATDTAGNLTTLVTRYLPDDIFLDDATPAFAERAGTWSSAAVSAWGTSSRAAVLAAGDSAIAEWTAPAVVPALYNVFAQVPKLASPAQLVEFRLQEDGETVSRTEFSTGIPTNQWVYLGTRHLAAGKNHSVEVIGHGSAGSGTVLSADVIRYSALVRNQWLVVPESFDVGEVIVNEQATRKLSLSNEGLQPVLITALGSTHGTIQPETPLPVVVPPMGAAQIEFGVAASVVGPLADTLRITSNDPRHLLVTSPVRGNVAEYYALVDDRDSLLYAEYGSWNFSTARAYGTTSRYAYPAPGVSAAFSTTLKRAGLYDIREIVPTTVNASVRARYLLSVNGVPADSAFLDQNAGSGAWVTVFRRVVNSGSQVRLEVSDAMSPVISGKVLRADAVRFQWISDGAVSVEEYGNPGEFELGQNYPNPFNPTTVVSCQWPVASDVALVVYDVLGQEVAILASGKYPAGRHEFTFDARNLPSGMYFVRLNSGGFTRTRKMVLAR